MSQTQKTQNLVISITMSQNCPGAVISITMSQTYPGKIYTPHLFKKYRQLDAALSENIDNLHVAHSFGHPITMSQSQQNKILLYP